SDVLGTRVKPEHADHPSALLARVGVLVVARTPAHLLEDRAVERVDETGERRLGLLADRVAGQPRERIGDRCDDGAVVLAGERVEAAKEGRKRRSPRARGRPHVVEEREPLLGSKCAHALVEETVAALVELPAVEPAAARVREYPLRPRQAHGRLLLAQEYP